MSQLEAHIEEQINAKARAAEQAALERRQAQEMRRRRELRRQQEQEKKQGKKSGASTDAQTEIADLAQERRAAKQGRLRRELATLDEQIKHLGRIVEKLGTDASAVGLAKAQTQLAVRQGAVRSSRPDMRQPPICEDVRAGTSNSLCYIDSLGRPRRPGKRMSPASSECWSCSAQLLAANLVIGTVEHFLRSQRARRLSGND